MKNYLDEAEKFRILRKEDFEAIANSEPSDELKKSQEEFRKSGAITFEWDEE